MLDATSYTAQGVALLTNVGTEMRFIYGGKVIRFWGSKRLIKIIDVKEWDDEGYIVIDAIYGGEPEPIEDYIDLYPLLEKLYINPAEYLKGLKKVQVWYE